MYKTHIYAPLIGDACGAHVCMWCMYVYVVHLCTYICVWWCMNVNKWSFMHEKWHFA